jgi:polyisoprenoid-binding protein YceI
LKKELKMRKISIIILAVVLTLAFNTQAQDWNFDKAHSTIGFGVKHMLIANVTGNFNDYDGKVVFDGKNLEKGVVELTINVLSINTNNEKRDEHLRSSDFFDMEKYPTITFKSTKIVKGEGNNFTLTGDLTMKGVSKPVILDCVLNGVITDPWGTTRAGFSGTTTIKRHDFNIAWDNKLQDGSFVVGEDIAINLQIELTKVESK